MPVDQFLDLVGDRLDERGQRPKHFRRERGTQLWRQDKGRPKYGKIFWASIQSPSPQKSAKAEATSSLRARKLLTDATRLFKSLFKMMHRSKLF